MKTEYFFSIYQNILKSARICRLCLKVCLLKRCRGGPVWPPEKAPLPKGGWHAHQKKSVTGGFSFMITGMFRGKVVGAALCGRPEEMAGAKPPSLR